MIWVDGTSEKVLPYCGSVWGRAWKRYNGCCLLFCLGGSCPTALVLMPDMSVLPCLPLVPFKLLPQCWSPEEVSMKKCVCSEETSENPTVSSTNLNLLVFTARSYGHLSSWHWNPGLGALVWGCSLAPKIFLSILSTTHGFGTSQFHVSMSPCLRLSIPTTCWENVVSLTP